MNHPRPGHRQFAVPGVPDTKNSPFPGIPDAGESFKTLRTSREKKIDK